MSLQNKRAERNEMLLCHEFHKKKFVLPDKENIATRKRRLQIESGGTASLAGMDGPDEAEAGGGAARRRGKAEYTGGLVLDPKVGLYDDFVMLLDFNSLYPSIIQEHNICFTTVDRCFASWSTWSICARPKRGIQGRTLVVPARRLRECIRPLARSSRRLRLALAKASIAVAANHPASPSLWAHNQGRLPKSPGLPLPLDDDRCIEMLVHIEKALPQQDTGLRVLHGGVGIFVVTEVIPGGLVEETNLRNKRAGVNCVQVNDQIIVVNGVSGNDALMTHEFKRSRCLTLGIRRYAEVSNKEGCLALELSNLVEQPEFNRGQQSPKKATAKHDHPLE